MIRVEIELSIPAASDDRILLVSNFVANALRGVVSDERVVVHSLTVQEDDS